MSTPDMVDRGRTPVPPDWSEADTLPLGPPPAGIPPDTGGGGPGDGAGGHGPPPAAVGGSRTYAFGLGRTATASGNDLLTVIVGGQTASDKDMADVHGDDNWEQVAIRTIR